ncbi:MAG: molybdopterin-dependent oxidoreductase [Deltaproteobacteria bacterium]|nr:molybdopterin-dependent oxidoreductase [Deltaproteobacteria bacterium]
METITLTIEGRLVSCISGTSILEVAEQNGFKIPNLCYHPSLKPFGACRLCLVEDEKTGRLMASCVTPAAPGMNILINTPRVKAHRTNIIRLMMAEHPDSCLVCSKGNRCKLREIASELGIGQNDLYPMPHYRQLEQANPFIIRDLTKCILCGKCIRADHELVVVGAIDYSLRGFNSRPVTVLEKPLEQSSCTFCGTCVSLCPTGALSIKSAGYIGTPERESPTICGFCGVGCSLVMGVASDRVVEVNPSHQMDTVNGSTLCVRGHFAHDFLNNKDRLTEPLVRKDGNLVPVSWDEALETVAERLLSIGKMNGPQSVGLFGSSKCTNEENYLFQKIARIMLHTNNIDNGGYIHGRSIMQGFKQRTDNGCRVNPLSSLENAEAIFVLGADTHHSLPVVSYYIKRASRKGITIILADPRKTDMAAFSSLWLPVFPHSDHAVINGIAALLSEEKAWDAWYVDRFTENFSAYLDSIKSLDLSRICDQAGLTRDSLEKAAGLLKGKRISFVIGKGIMQQRNGQISLDAVLNLALMTGSLGADNAGIYLLEHENNQTGAWDMGTVPDSLPGRLPLNDNSARKHWELAWQCRLPTDPGLNIMRMIEEAEKGNLKALYVMGENPLRSLPQTHRVREALKGLELLVVQEILMNETTEMADVVLPGAAFAEKGGSFTNIEGRIQTFAPVVSPPGNAKPDWEILDLLAPEMGYPKVYGALEKIRREISQFVHMYADMGKEGVGSSAWVKEMSGKMIFRPGEPGGLVSFVPVDSPSHETTDDEYPFTAILGSLRYHLGSGTRTGRSPRIHEFTTGTGGEIEISKEDAEAMGLSEGDRIRVASASGSIERGIKIEKSLRTGLIFIPLAFNNNDALNLIGFKPLGEADSPGWKECRVSIEKITGQGGQ